METNSGNIYRKLVGHNPSKFEEKQFEGNACQKLFSPKSCLQSDLRMHAGEKSPDSDKCGSVLRGNRGSVSIRKGARMANPIHAKNAAKSTHKSQISSNIKKLILRRRSPTNVKHVERPFP